MNVKEKKSLERLDKILANSGFGTRKEVRHYIRCRTVTVNGNLVTDADAPVNIETDTIAINGEPVQVKFNLYLMMNKKDNYVCSTKGGMHPTVFDLLDDKEHTKFLGGELHIVGRLDVDTEGLLILTTDGALTHRLTSPKWHVAKTYLLYLRDPVSQEERERYTKELKQGVHIAAEDNESEADCLPAEIEWKDENKYFSIDAKDNPCTDGSQNGIPQIDDVINHPPAVAYLTVYEGKYHEVKRLLKALGNEVIYLKRISINKLELDPSIPIGKYRELTPEEIKMLDVTEKEL